jgi:hypothetical protein
MVTRKQKGKHQSGDKMKKKYLVEAVMEVCKTYVVNATSEKEAMEKLANSGIVQVKQEENRPESYNEEYRILGVANKNQQIDIK